jgi:hypothetical protein
MALQKRSTTANLALRVDQAPNPPSRKDDLVAMIVSAGLHAMVLVLLALWVLPTVAGGNRVIRVSAGDSESIALESIDDTNVADAPPIEIVEAVEARVEIFQPEALEIPTFEFASNSEPAEVVSTSFTVSATGPSASTSSPTISGAVDRVLADIQQRLSHGDLLVVWLLDASHSLVDDRKRVAERLEPFYADLIDGRRDSGHQLHSAVVSYGSSIRERVPPTQFGQRIVDAVEDLPVDRSGNEKVFDAVAKCATNYRQSRPDTQLLIVIWTDESGDDVDNLESTIQVCRNSTVSVSVVGPSSVLGADTGLHSYTDPKSNSVYQLPVRRGPDTAMQEKLELGYWFVDRGGRRGRRGADPIWAGGRQLVGLLSGFSPYALTRLSQQTGGAYTILDREQDRAPFDNDLLRAYRPEYGSLQQYEQQIEAHPLRRAVLNAVRETNRKKLSEPPTMLFIKRTGERVFDYMRYYYPPDQFLARLRSSRSRLKGQALRNAKIIEKALRHVSEDDTLSTGLDHLYQYETSPRWRAWYDLTRGRLLVASVRLEEYRLTIDAMTQSGALASTTNHVILIPRQETRYGESFRRRAEEAEFLLRRCVQQNQGTPWEVLAQRELDYALGIGVREMALTLQPGGPAPRNPVLPKF